MCNVRKLADRLRDVIEEAVRSAVSKINEGMTELAKEVSIINERIDDLGSHQALRLDDLENTNVGAILEYLVIRRARVKALNHEFV